MHFNVLLGHMAAWTDSRLTCDTGWLSSRAVEQNGSGESEEEGGLAVFVNNRCVTLATS